MPIVSVIVPIYNVERYLPRCLDTILSQSFTDFELILVDDGSPDRCSIICDEYKAKDERIQVIHQKNAKLSAARNAGIDAAQGEWLAFVDSDDWIHKDYLKILLSGVIDDTDLVICGCQITSKVKETDEDYSGTQFRSVTMDDIYKNQYSRNQVWGKLYRRSAVGELRYIPGTEPIEDKCFNELFFRRDVLYRITDARLYYYYMRADSATHRSRGWNTLNAVQIFSSQLGKVNDKEKRERIIKRCFKCVVAVRYNEMFSLDYVDIKKKSTELIKQLAVYLPELNRQDRLIMWMFSTFPFMYRSWRILGDPSLLRYERDKKKARNKCRKQKRNRTDDAYCESK